MSGPDEHNDDLFLPPDDLLEDEEVDEGVVAAPPTPADVPDRPAQRSAVSLELISVDDLSGEGGDPDAEAGAAAPAETVAAPAGGASASVPELRVDPAVLTALQEELHACQEALAKAEIEAKEWKDQALRRAADFENARRRFQREREEAALAAKEQTLRELLPPLDDLERALTHAAQGGGDEHPLFAGVRMIQRKYIGILEKLQCHPVDSRGQRFDPNHHEALQQVDDVTVPDQTIVDEFQKGYTHQGRLLRAALVVVSRGGPQRAEAQGPAAEESPEGGSE